VIKIHQEPNPEQPFENCCFCRTPTSTWATQVNVAVCLCCSTAFAPEDLPTKLEWFTKERKIREGRGR
jgi:hypothetical protein